MCRDTDYDKKGNGHKPRTKKEKEIYVMKKNMNKGFSLVELIIVIAIMAVLVGVLAPQFIKYVESSRQSTDIDNLAEYKAAVEAAVADVMAEGKSADGIQIDVTGGANGTISLSGNDDVEEKVGEVGLGSTDLKSSGWASGSASYDDEEFEWTTSGLDSENDKKPHKKLIAAFE